MTNIQILAACVVQGAATARWILHISALETRAFLSFCREIRKSRDENAAFSVMEHILRYGR